VTSQVVRLSCERRFLTKPPEGGTERKVEQLERESSHAGFAVATELLLPMTGALVNTTLGLTRDFYHHYLMRPHDAIKIQMTRQCCLPYIPMCSDAHQLQCDVSQKRSECLETSFGHTLPCFKCPVWALQMNIISTAASRAAAFSHPHPGQLCSSQ
jgi:hypothetical protein